MKARMMNGWKRIGLEMGKSLHRQTRRGWVGYGKSLKALDSNSPIPAVKVKSRALVSQVYIMLTKTNLPSSMRLRYQFHTMPSIVA
jgi:hypothetical protein